MIAYCVTYGNIHCVPKKIRLVWPWISCTVASWLQWNLARNILMILAIKYVQNLPPHFSYVSTLPNIIQNEKLRCLPLNSVSGSEKNPFWWVWSGSEKEMAMWLDYSRCSKWRPVAFTNAHGRVWHWTMASSMMPWGIRSQASMSHCLSSSLSQTSVL